jgi:hypothetical protein
MEAQHPKRISRTELYARVWQTPMTRLGLELGISGNGLAKICQRLDVPYSSLVSTRSSDLTEQLFRCIDGLTESVLLAAVGLVRLCEP